MAAFMVQQWASSCDRLSVPQSWKYLLLGPSQKTLASLCVNRRGWFWDSWTRGLWFPSMWKSISRSGKDKIKQNKMCGYISRSAFRTPRPEPSGRSFSYQKQLVPFQFLAVMGDVFTRLTWHSSSEFALCWLWAIEQVTQALGNVSSCSSDERVGSQCMGHRVSTLLSWAKFSDSVMTRIISYLKQRLFF